MLCHGRVRELLFLIEKSRKKLLRFDLQKTTNFVIHVKILQKHLSKKLIDYRYRFKKLRFIDHQYRPELFE